LKFGIEDLPIALTRAGGFDIPLTLYQVPCISIEDIMRVAKWGNSFAVRLPKALVEALGVRVGDEVELSPLPNGAIGIGKVDPGAEFLARMAEFNVPAPEGYRFDRDEANER
jgi:antitoxin MazE